MRKFINSIICVFSSVMLLFPLSASAWQSGAGKSVAKPFTVVIDAGHGGHDAGAVGKIAKEKDLNLAVSKLVGELIATGHPDVKVVYTRKTDVFLTLQQRADIVNKNNADLFICIHTNAAENRNVSGAETFVLGIDKMQSNLDVAMRENAVIMMEDNYETTYEGFDPTSVDSYIMFELMQDQYIDRSLQFATLVQQEFSGSLQRADRGVRQAGFWVLHKSACPSVLIEMGFISNREEERYLASQKGKDDIANAIYDAFTSYKAAYDKRHGKEVTAAERPKRKAADEQELTQTPQREETPTPAVQPAKKTQTAQTDKKTTPAQTDKKTQAAKPVYRIQIFTTTTELKKNDPTFKGLKNCRYTKDGKYYKYTYGEETDYQTIADIQKQLKAKFKDCFIVAFLNGKQITVKEARQLTK